VHSRVFFTSRPSGKTKVLSEPGRVETSSISGPDKKNWTLVQINATAVWWLGTGVL